MIIVLFYIYLFIISYVFVGFYFSACVCVCVHKCLCVGVGDTAMSVFTFRNVLRDLEQNTGNTVILVFTFTSSYLLLLKLINGSIFVSEEFNSMIYLKVSICFIFFGM